MNKVYVIGGGKTELIESFKAKHPEVELIIITNEDLKNLKVVDGELEKLNTILEVEELRDLRKLENEIFTIKSYQYADNTIELIKPKIDKQQNKYREKYHSRNNRFFKRK